MIFPYIPSRGHQTQCGKDDCISYKTEEMDTFSFACLECKRKNCFQESRHDNGNKILDRNLLQIRKFKIWNEEKESESNRVN